MEEATREKVGPQKRQVMRYTLDVVDCGGNGDRCYMSKGHHEATDFLRECENDNGRPLDGWCAPVHAWWRAVPDPQYEDGASRYVDAQPHSRGAFPVTYTEPKF